MPLQQATVPHQVSTHYRLKQDGVLADHRRDIREYGSINDQIRIMIVLTQTYLHPLVFFQRFSTTDTFEISIYSMQYDVFATTIRIWVRINTRNLVSCANSLMRPLTTVRVATFATLDGRPAKTTSDIGCE